MPHYSPERKEAILQKMAPPHSLTVAELASQEGISTATLYNWRKAARGRGAVLPSNSAHPDKWSSEEKFRIVLETAPMAEAGFMNIAVGMAFTRNKSKPGKPPAWEPMPCRMNRPSRIGKRPGLRKNVSKNSKPSCDARKKLWQKRLLYRRCQKKPRRSGAPKMRTNDQPPGSPAGGYPDPRGSG